MTNKPKAVKEVEAAADTALSEAWAKLESGQAVTEEDYPFIIEASRADRARWLIRQAKKGKDMP